MSVNRNRAKLLIAYNNKVYRRILINMYYPAYWDDGLVPYPHCRRGFKQQKKRIYYYQVRMYKTWKHNRKNQWK